VEKAVLEPGGNDFVHCEKKFVSLRKTRSGRDATPGNPSAFDQLSRELAQLRLRDAPPTA